MTDLKRESRPINYWIYVVYLILLALIIPWYWPEGEARILFGFPVWILASLGALFMTSCFTAWLCLRDKGSAD